MRKIPTDLLLFFPRCVWLTLALRGPSFSLYMKVKTVILKTYIAVLDGNDIKYVLAARYDSDSKKELYNKPRSIIIDPILIALKKAGKLRIPLRGSIIQRKLR